MGLSIVLAVLLYLIGRKTLCLDPCQELLFKLHITHLYFPKLKGKEKFEKRFSQLRKNLENSFVTS